MTKNRNCKLLAVTFVVVCMFVAMLGGYVGLFNITDTPDVVANAATSTIESYYQPLADDMNKTGTAFRTQVASLITSTHSYNPTYDGLRNIFDESDADPNKSGNIIWFYTGTSVPFSGSFSTGTNREHVWPKNAGNAFPAESETGSDAHHLRPCNDNLNSTRSNNSFGEVAQTTSNIVKEEGSTSYGNANDPDSYCYQASSTFYPSAEFRGDTARILMYVQTRWGDKFNLTFVLGNGSNKTIGDIEDLFKWHLLDPPSEAEMRRNEVVYGIQGNRNPFIDHPEYAEMIYCYDGQSYNDELQAVLAQYGGYLDKMVDDTLEVTSVSLTPSSSTLTVGEKINLSVSVQPENAVKTVTWTSSNPNVASVSNGVVTALSAGTTTITATSTKTPSVKATATIAVKSLSAISITGTPNKTTYYAGDKFDPTGLTVTATYSDNSTATISNSQVTWIDGTTRQNTLAEGSTTVIAKYGNFEKTVSGITVNAPVNVTFTFGDDSTGGHVDGSSATTVSYTQGSYTLSITNGTSLFAGAFDETGKSALKLGTSSKTGSFQFTVPSGVNSVIIYVAQYKANATAVTINGTTHTINTASNSGQYTAITVNTSSTKTVTVATTSSGKRCMIDKIEFVTESGTGSGNTGGGNTGGTTCSHQWGNWTTTDEPSCDKAGVSTRECALCGEKETKPIDKLNHTWGDWVADGLGAEIRECSVCHTTEDRVDEDFDWSVGFKNAVNNVVSAEGLEAKWTSIKVALNAYANMQPEHRQDADCVAAYNTLKEEISNYNSAVGEINTESQKATSDAINLFAGSMSMLAFAAYLLLKKA